MHEETLRLPDPENDSLDRATKLLANPRRPIGEVAHALGLDHPTFCRKFRAWSGMAPSEWRDAHVARKTATPDMMSISVSLLTAIANAATSVAIEDGRVPPPFRPPTDERGLVRLPYLWEALEEIAGRPGDGIRMAERLGNDALDVVWLCVRASANHRAALADLARFLPLLASDLELSVVEVGRIARLELVTPWLLHPLGAEMVLALLVRNSRLLLPDEHPDPLAVELAHPAPSDASIHERFFGCPVRFGQPRPALAWPVHRLDTPHRDADDTAHARATACAENRQEERAALQFEEQVRREYRRAVGARDPQLPAIARRLGLSPRALQRDLAEAKLSHRGLVDDARHEAARTLLAHSDKTIKEVAFEVGFANPAAFIRSFRRWAGMTPGDYRASRGA